MRLTRAAWPVLCSAGVLMVVPACGSTSGSNVDGNGSGHPGSAGTAGLDLNQAGSNETATGGGSSAVGDTCAGKLIQAERIPLDMYVMLDVSGSMLEPTAGDAMVTKWDAVSSALEDFVSDPASDGIGMGLQVFPIVNPAAPKSCTSDDACGTLGPCLNKSCWPLINGAVDSCLDDTWCQRGQTCKVIGECSVDTTYVCDSTRTAVCDQGKGDCVVPSSICLSATDCRPATYAAASAEIAALPGAKPGLLKVIQGSMPDLGGLTPTGPALTGAIQHAAAWAQTHPDHQTVAVLATDGVPTLQTKGQLCAAVAATADISAVVNVAGSGLTGTPPISTFVIGVLSPDDLTSGAPGILDAIAMSGGTGQAFVVNTQNNVQQQFRDALNKIRASGLSCDLAVPQAEAGKTIDFGRVNVTFDNGSGPMDLLNWPDAAGCGAQGGWYYDVDPAKGTPKRIVACPSTCMAFEKTDMGSVQIKLGCETHSIVK